MFSLRQEQMKQYIEQENVVTIKALQQMFPNVSLMTIHRDLDALEMQGVAVKFRGGARSVRYTTDPEFNVRMRENNAGKVQIARKALELEKLRSHAYSTMIDLAEQTFNIPVRKKSGTKQ